MLGFQDKLVLNLLWPLQEVLLEGRSRSGVLQSLLQQPSSLNMAHFNYRGMFMTYMEKNVNIDSDRWWCVWSNLPYRERVCHTGVTADLKVLLGREGCDSQVSIICTLTGTHCKKQVPKPKRLNHNKKNVFRHLAWLGRYIFISELHTIDFHHVSIWEYLCPSSFCLGEGNGTPLQYSCLENPMDRGAW